MCQYFLEEIDIWHVTCDTGHLTWGENSLNMPAMLTTDPPPTSTTGDTWQVTHERWHMTGDTGQVTCVMWHFVWGEHSLKFQLSCSNSWELLCFEDLEEKDHWLVNELINYKVVCRRPPATPGLLNISPLLLLYEKFRKLKFGWIYWVIQGHSYVFV